MVFKAQGQCPHCARKGKKISLKKLKLHVDDLTYITDEFDYYICKNPSCEVVYFNIANEFLSSQVNKEIGYKKSASPEALICYCYNVSKSQLNEHTIGYVKTKMQEYACECSKRNPYGKCCLKEIKKLQKSSL